MLKLAIAAFALFDAILIASSASANTLATWTNNAGDNAWETAGNWDINQVPNNNSFDVRIATSAPCNLSSQFQIGALTLSTSTANLNLLPGSLLAIDSSNGINNSGRIIVNPTAANSTTVLRFDTSASINGSGGIGLNGINPGNAMISGDGVTVTNNAGMGGYGDISFSANNAVLVNNGTIGATSPSQTQYPLRIFLSNAAGNQNNGTIIADGTGLLIEQGFLDQSGGGVLAAQRSGVSGGSVQIGVAQAVTIVGGSLRDSTGLSNFGIIQGIAAILAGNITTPGITNAPGIYEIPANDFTYVTATTLTSNGIIQLDASSSLLRFDASTSITGFGYIDLGKGTMEINNNSIHNVINGSGHTIKGNGTIQIDPGSTLTNNGIIAPGDSPGTLNFSGNLQLNFPSNLSFQIGGTNQGTDYDVLHKIDNGTLTLNGKLTVSLINSFTPASADTFTIITTQSPLAGSFTNVANGARLNTSDGSGSFVVTYTGNNVVLSSFGPPTPSQLLNISTRLNVLTGDNVGIGGFIITGSDDKKVLLRGLGPSLTNQGVSGALQDPTLELHDSNGATLAVNDNWKDSQQAEIEATGIPPSNDLESAIVATLPANNSGYTAILRGKNDTTGVGLVEVYDLVQAANSKLANISTRGFVEVLDNVMIGGVIVGPGNGSTVLVRAIGPSLAGQGVPDPLQDPTLELDDRNGNVIARNDNWKDTQQTEIQATGIAPTNDLESAILATLAPGNYTAIVQRANNATGVALVEVYDLK